MAELGADERLKEFDVQFVPIHCVTPGREFVAPDSIANASRREIKRFIQETYMEAYREGYMAGGDNA